MPQKVDHPRFFYALGGSGQFQQDPLCRRRGVADGGVHRGGLVDLVTPGRDANPGGINP